MFVIHVATDDPGTGPSVAAALTEIFSILVCGFYYRFYGISFLFQDGSQIQTSHISIILGSLEWHICATTVIPVTLIMYIKQQQGVSTLAFLTFII